MIEEVFELNDRKAVRWHAFYGGKIEILPKCPIRGLDDFSIWYTPGVAEVCNEIAEDEEKAYDYTNKGNLVAIVTDGSRTLGLGMCHCYRRVENTRPGQYWCKGCNASDGGEGFTFQVPRWC